MMLLNLPSIPNEVIKKLDLNHDHFELHFITLIKQYA